ncbi:MAG TPA: FlgD immunoglobulin-like domain containing protein, partial [Candidatus Cloacimonadota bacterium]|nr:FlgD immunoglobulin-like domain containing protein [Candidatus Cloacimonadota bacterium]
PWTYFSCPVEAGTHTFDWVYVKDSGDGSSFIEDDCAWVDLITFPCVTPAATGTVSGNISFIPTADPQNATVQIGSAICHPDATGAFSLEVPVGNYTATASLEGYETISINDVSVLENQITSISFELYYLQAPENLEAVQNDAVVDLTWEHNQPTGNSGIHHAGRELQNFNVYRNVNGGTFQLIDSTTEFSYEDVLPSAGEYIYYVTAQYEQESESAASNQVTVIWDGLGSDDPLEPCVNALYQNSPNPFNPETTITFSVTQSSAFATLEIFNMKGQKVKTLVNTTLSAGRHAIVWNGEDDDGKVVSSGIYFYKLRSGDFQKTRKMLLLK